MAKKETKSKSVVKREKIQKEAEGFVVTQEYFDAHPELEAEGVAVGDTIEVPVVPKETSLKLKLGGEIAILKHGQYIRTFPKGSEENVNAFLTKDAGYVAVEASSIESISVSWREKGKNGVMEAKSTTFSEKTHGEDWKQEARELANEAPGRNCMVKLG